MEQLHHAIQSNRVAHAYLISGEAGSGKRALARAFTEALFCKDEARSVCGECDNCRLIKGGNHPDVTIVEPQGASIRIDQIRALQDKFALRTYGGLWKVGIIVDADLMTQAAANSLLKLLEEPSGQAVIMLLTTSPTLLLPTIVSRCQTISLRRIPRASIAAYLANEHDIPAEAAMVIAGLADGSLGQARTIASGDQLNWRERILTVITAEQGRGLEALRLAATLDGAPEAIEFAMHVLTTWFRDLMLVAKGCPKQLVVNQDYLPDLLVESSVYNVQGYQAAIALIEDTLRAIRGNANRRLALDALFYQIVDVTSLSRVSEVYDYGKSSRR